MFVIVYLTKDFFKTYTILHKILHCSCPYILKTQTINSVAIDIIVRSTISIRYKLVLLIFH